MYLTPAQAQRFWSRVKKTDTCWLWFPLARGDGYAHFYLTSKLQRVAHRVAYMELVGPIPNGLQLDHLCRVRHCVNPEHLEAVTPKVNVLRSTVGRTQRARTHCPQGHPYLGHNIKWRHGFRSCRICFNLQRNRYRRNYRKRRREENQSAQTSL